MTIVSTDPVQTYYTCGEKQIPVLLEVGKTYQIPVLLEVGKTYQIVHSKPTNKKDRANNGRIVKVLGFTASYMGDVVVRYMDNNRRGRVHVGCLLPYPYTK